MTRTIYQIAYGCYKAESRWLAGLVNAQSSGANLTFIESMIVKPRGFGEKTRLVVSGKNAGQIIAPDGSKVRMLIANPPINSKFVDEVSILNGLVDNYSSRAEYSQTPHNYLELLIKTLELLIGDQFNTHDFRRNVK